MIKRYQKYEKHDIKRLSKSKDRERKFGIGRPFKLDEAWS